MPSGIESSPNAVNIAVFASIRYLPTYWLHVNPVKSKNRNRCFMKFAHIPFIPYVFWCDSRNGAEPAILP